VLLSLWEKPNARPRRRLGGAGGGFLRALPSAGKLGRRLCMTAPSTTAPTVG